MCKHFDLLLKTATDKDTLLGIPADGTLVRSVYESLQDEKLVLQ